MKVFKENRYFSMIIDILLFLSVFFIVLVPVSTLYIKHLIGHPVHWKWFLDNGVLLLIINDLIQLPIIILVYKLVKKENLFNVVNFTWSGTSNMITGILAGIAAGAFTMGLVFIPYIQEIIPEFQGNIRFLASENIFIFIISLMINPLYKEMLFRGIVFRRLKDNMNTILALFIQSIIYAMVVQGITMPMRFYAFLSALLMGTLYIWGRSIWIPVTGGIFCNITYGLLFYTPLKFLVNSTSVLYTTVVALVMLAGALIYLIKKNNSLIKQIVIK